jgi:polyisoprenoid-binding protein YceI
MKTQSILLLSLLILASGCSDPADKVQKAAASEPAKTNAAAPDAKAGKEYVVRAESTVNFVASKVTRSHDGGFKNIAGTVQVADGKIVGSPEIRINMKSIWTDTDKLTGHLKTPDFFDVEKYPVSTFTVTSIEPAGAQQKVTGNLNMHGETKSISFPADIQIADDAVTINAEFAINRRDFNVNYPGKPNDLIRDNVVLKLAVKATPGPARPEDQIAN